MIPVLDLKTQRRRISDSLEKRIKKVIDHGKFILGPEVDELEEKLKDFTGAKHCISCANGTDALQISLMALNISPGDEVIVPAFSYIATAEAVALLGAKPIYVDISLDTFSLNTKSLENVINKKTKAIIPVSLFGQPADFKSINILASKYNIPVIEDGAQSFGSTHNGNQSCNLSTIGCTSFFPSKPLGCYGDGGAIFTSNEELASSIRQIARHGQVKRYYHKRLGINSRLDTIQAAILLEKLIIFEQEIRERDFVAKRYAAGFLRNTKIKTPNVEKENTSSWAQYTIMTSERDELKSFLANNGVQTAIHYPMPLYEQDALKEKLNLENSKKASETVLSLPISGTLPEEEQDFIINLILNFV